MLFRSSRKWMDSSRLNKLGWQPKIDLQMGLAMAYQDFLEHAEMLRVS